MVMLSARPEQIDINFARSALIVVDMQNAFASPGGMMDLAGLNIAGAADVVTASRDLIAGCRARGVKIVYMRMTYQPDLSDAGGPGSPNYHKEIGIVLMRDRPDLAGKLLTEGSWDWQIVDELTPQDGDYVINKSRYSGFCGTNLETYLRGQDIRHLFFCGIATNVCVESTARDAYFAEFWPVLVEDAMNHAGPDFTRDATLWNFENIFGWITTVDQLCAAMVRPVN